MNQLENSHLKKIMEIDTWLCNITNLRADLRIEIAIKVYKAIQDEINKESLPINGDPELDPKEKEPVLYVHDLRCSTCGQPNQVECEYMETRGRE